MTSNSKQQKAKLRITTRLPTPISQSRVETVENNLQKKYFGLSVMIVFLCFGIYYSILYFGHHIMPSPDFPSFLEVGRQLWSFKIPTNFMRGPVYGLLVYPLSYVVGGQHPELTAGWLVNALLQPCNLILLFLVGRQIIGKSALWLALLAILNPWLIEVFTKPIAEVTLIFFILLTFLFMFRGSSLCYLFASLATMVRYECTVLILAAFILDMIQRKSRKERIYAFCYSILASIPLGFWMLGTMLSNNASMNYIQFINIKKLTDIVTIKKELELLWAVTFASLFRFSPQVSDNTVQILDNICKFFACISFGFGVIWGLLKKQWNILALLIFFIPYMLVHISYSFSDARFYTPVFWILLLICCYGLQNCWLLLNTLNRIPKPIIIALQIIILLVGFGWCLSLAGFIPQLNDISPRSVSLPYVAISTVLLIVAAGALIYKGKHLWRNSVMLAVLCPMILSNQFLVASVVKDGQSDAEFKQLLDWYIQNAKPGEKMVTTLSGLLDILAPAYKGNFIPTGEIKADSPEAVVNLCYSKGITYIAWDSRIGLIPNNIPDYVFYRNMRLDNIDMLRNPKSTGPWEYITTIYHKTQRDRYINVFRLRAPSVLPKEKSTG